MTVSSSETTDDDDDDYDEDNEFFLSIPSGLFIFIQMRIHIFHVFLITHPMMLKMGEHEHLGFQVMGLKRHSSGSSDMMIGGSLEKRRGKNWVKSSLVLLSRTSIM